MCIILYYDLLIFISVIEWYEYPTLYVNWSDDVLRLHFAGSL